MNRSTLVKVLELVKPALATNNTVPILQCFTFRSNGTVSGSDDSIAIVGPVDYQNTFALHGNTLLGLLSNSSVEEVEIIANTNEVVLKAGKTVSKLPFQSEDSFIFEPPDCKWDFKLPFTESLHEALLMCLETVSKDEAQPALKGITIQGNKLYSCDGDAITRVLLNSDVGKHRALLSTAFCEAVLKLWSTLRVTGGMLHFSSDWVYADFDDWSVYGRVLEIPTPIDFEAEITKTVKGKAITTAVPAGFSDALSRARVLADPESQKTSIAVEKRKMHLLTETHMGEVHDTLPCEGHPDVMANVNASHLQRALVYCDKMLILDNCVVFEKSPNVFQIVSNMG